MKADYQKALKKLTLLFHSNAVLCNGQNYPKQKGPETSHWPIFSLRKSLYLDNFYAVHIIEHECARRMVLGIIARLLYLHIPMSFFILAFCSKFFAVLVGYSKG